MTSREKLNVVDMVQRKDWAGLRSLLTKYPVPEIADLLTEADKKDRVLIFRALPRDVAADVFSYLEPVDQDSLLRDLTDEETRTLMANMAPDDRVALLEELPAKVTQRLLTLLSPEDLKEARQLLGYPDESVGRLMTPDYVAVRPEWTVGQSLEHVRNTGADKENINTIYVTDTAGKLLGSVSLAQLILEDPSRTVGDIMQPAISVSGFDDREKAAKVMDRYDISVVPVVDSQGTLVGIVTSDDVFEVAKEETTEDFHKGAGMAPIKMTLMDAGIGLLYRNRITWLLGMVLVYLVSANIMARFEQTISMVIPLVFFLPLLIDSIGNAGSQSAVLMVRALATGEVGPSEWIKVLVKEAGVSAALGAALGFTVWVIATITSGIQIATVVGLSMLINVFLICMAGTVIPMVMHKFGMDPAVASSPLVTSLADIVGVLLYFSIATWYLRI